MENPDLSNSSISTTVPRRGEKRIGFFELEIPYIPIHNGKQKNLIEGPNQKRYDYIHIQKKFCSATATSRTSLEKEPKITINMFKLAEEIWQKKYCLRRKGDSPEWFPVPKALFQDPVWSIPYLLEQKRKLNNTKSLLDELPLDDWHKHTKLMNTAGEVMPMVRQQQAEYCSQAWCKMYECLCNFQVIPNVIVDAARQTGCLVPFFSVHLCEAPGAFVSALNHFIHTNFPQIKWDWLATTLNPHHEGNDVGSMINEDKLILSSLTNWTFLQDTTGDIMNQENLQKLITEVKRRIKKRHCGVNLVTADGSIDCQTNPSEQEATVAQLHFAEIVAALNILCIGGTFILKIFTFLECETMNHLRLLSSLFREVHLYKPATSKEGNSEVYVICLEYLGFNDFKKELIELTKLVGASNPPSEEFSLISKDVILEGPFLGRLGDAATFFTNYQMAIIERNITTYEAKDSRATTYYQYNVIRTEVATEWLNRYTVRMLPDQNCLFGLKNKGFSKQINHVDPREEGGSFLDKMQRKSADVWVRMDLIQKHLQYYQKFGCLQWTVSEMKVKGTCHHLKVLCGKPYRNILSSRFCHGRLLQQREDLRNAVEPFQKLIIETEVTRSTCGCELKNVQDCFSNSLSDIKNSAVSWTVYSICFRQTIQDFYGFTDIEHTHSCLRKILLKLTDMDVGQSLFLCMYPCLSRLQVGFICAISSLFGMVLLSPGGKNLGTPRGILLHRYLGIHNLPEKTLLTKLAEIVKDIGFTSSTNSVLEIVPVKIMLQLDNYNDVLKYNLFTTASQLNKLITETRNLLNQNLGPHHKTKPTSLSTANTSTTTNSASHQEIQDSELLIP